MNEFKSLADQSSYNNKELGEIIGVKTSTIRHWKSGRREAPQVIIDYLKARLNLENWLNGPIHGGSF